MGQVWEVQTNFASNYSGVHPQTLGQWMETYLISSNFNASIHTIQLIQLNRNKLMRI